MELIVASGPMVCPVRLDHLTWQAKFHLASSGVRIHPMLFSEGAFDTGLACDALV